MRWSYEKRVGTEKERERKRDGDKINHLQEGTRGAETNQEKLCKQLGIFFWKKEDSAPSFPRNSHEQATLSEPWGTPHLSASTRACQASTHHWHNVPPKRNLIYFFRRRQSSPFPPFFVAAYSYQSWLKGGFRWWVARIGKWSVLMCRQNEREWQKAKAFPNFSISLSPHRRRLLGMDNQVQGCSSWIIFVL